MQRYALEIRPETLTLITLLNQGVTPAIEEEVTYFIFDAEWNSEVSNEIMSEYDFVRTELRPSPSLYHLV